jgi:hypothetical protein
MLKPSHCVIMRVTKVWGHRHYKHNKMVCIHVAEYMTYWSIEWRKWAETFAFPFFRGMTSRNIPEERKHQLHRCKNLKLATKSVFILSLEKASITYFLYHSIYICVYIYIYIYIYINTHYSIGVVVYMYVYVYTGWFRRNLQYFGKW